MRSFFKIFFASFLSLIIFFLLAFFILIAVVTSMATKDRPRIADRSVLVIDLKQTFHERFRELPLGKLTGDDDRPGLYDVIRLIENARTDDHIKGIYIIADGNNNGFAASNELRQALLHFRSSRKFVLAHGDLMSQGAYFVASAADKVYVNPSGLFDWKGMSVTLFFVKQMLDKLGIQPQIFYAGKFKSATEIFRTSQMTPENRLQTTEWLNDLYAYFLSQCSRARNVDTATLHQLANTAAIRTPQDAVRYKLIDAVRYDDEVKSELKQRLGLDKSDALSLVPVNTYHEAVSLVKTGRNRVAVIYAEGDIVDGQGSSDNIGGDRFRAIIRKARMDGSVKAIVLRVNSGGGSALASENIWRELQQAKGDGKPVVVSFGDVAASGGYYIACGADSIFASPNTITGSIGVFGVIPNMEGFFKNKLGVTFDGVKTAPYADAPNIYRPMNEAEKQMVQSGVDRIYQQFKARVAQGRKRDTVFIDSIAQGRVWSGMDAVHLGLVDRFGNLHDAIVSAARLAKLDSYGIREYPETENWLDRILQRQKTEPAAVIREQLGEENYRVYRELLRIREMTHSLQARLPFEFQIQ